MYQFLIFFYLFQCVLSQRLVSVLAGSNFLDGTGSGAALGSISELAYDPSTNSLVAIDSNILIRRISLTG